MKGCMYCGEKETLYYTADNGMCCAICFVKYRKKVNKDNFLRVRIDIGNKLQECQKRKFNEICEEFKRHKLLELLGFKLKLNG